MSRFIRQTISSFLAFLLVFGMIAVNQNSASAAAKKFTDLEQKHNWALKDITKMSIKRIVEGTPDGRFLPDQAVSQEQALAMVLRAMGQKEEAEAYIGADYASLYQGVSPWATGYVSVAHREGLIKQEESSRFKGGYAASREWTAQLLVRMINKEQEAADYDYISSDFSDKNDISGWASNSVKLAASDDFELIKGFPNSDGTYSFKPKVSVTRAQLAVLISRAERFLAEQVGNVYEGEILSINDDGILLETNVGQKSLTLSSDTQVYKENQKVSLSALQRFQPVLVLSSSSLDSNADYIEILDEAVAQEIITGTLSKVVKDFSTIAITTNGELKNYKLIDGVVFGSKDGTVQSLDDLAITDTIEVTVVGGKVRKIYRLMGLSEQVTTGTVYEVDHQFLTIQKGTDSARVYTLSDTVSVQYPDNRMAGTSGLRKGMEVELTLDNNTVIGVKVVTIVEEGKVISISPDKTIITIQNQEQKPYVYQLTSDASIKIQGIEAKASDIMPGDQVILQVGSDGKANQIEITNRQGKIDTSIPGEYIQGKVFSVDQTTNILMLEMEKDGKKSYQPYEFDDSFELHINGEWKTNLDDIKKDMNAKIQLYDNKIVFLEVDNRLAGTVVRVDEDRRILTLALEGGEQRPFYVDSSYDVTIKHESGEDLSDLDLNDVVRVKLDKNEKIIEIDVQRDFAYMITDIYESSKKIYVEDEDEDEHSLYLNSNVTLTIPGKDRPKITDLNEDEIVRATFLGDDLIALQVLPSYRGMVTNINLNTTEYTVLKNDGTSVKLSFGSGDVIKYKSYEYTQLSSLAVNDRVFVQSWLGSKTRLTKMEKITEKFYYKDNNYIYAVENVRDYKYSPDVFVRGADNKGVTLDSLKKNDSISLYRLGDLVYEIHKPN